MSQNLSSNLTLSPTSKPGNTCVEEVVDVLSHFYSDDVQHISYIFRGVNDIFRAKIGNMDCCIRVGYEFNQSRKNIEFECRVINSLNDAGLNKLSSIQSKDGSYFVSFIDSAGRKRNLTVFCWLKGECERNRPLVSFSTRSANVLANIHRYSLENNTAVDEITGSILRDFDDLDIRKFLDQYLYFYPILIDDYSNVFKFALEFVQSLQNHKLTTSICHGDVHPGNFIHAKPYSSAIDFDDIGFGPIVYDVASYLWAIDLFKLDQKYSSAFLDEYLSKGLLERSDISKIASFKLVRDVVHTIRWGKQQYILGNPWHSENNIVFRHEVLINLYRKARRNELF